MVSHPDHYQSENGMEVINVIEAFTAGLTGVEAYDAGNIIKYACRWSKKNGIQDLEKIIWYATHLIEHLKKKQVDVTTKPIKPEKEFDESNDVGYMEYYKPGEDEDDSFGYHYLIARFHMLLNARKIFSNIVNSNQTYTITLHPERLNTIVLAAGHSIPDEYFTYNGVDDWSFEGGYEYEGVEESYGTIDDEECLKANYTRKEVYDIFVELVKEGKILSTEILNEIHSYRDCVAPDGEIIPDTIEIIGFTGEELMFTFSVNDRDHYILSDEDQNIIVDTLLEDLK